jgi:hypothetical protein
MPAALFLDAATNAQQPLGSGHIHGGLRCLHCSYLLSEDADDKLRLPNRAQTANDRETRRNAMAAGRLTTFFGLLSC